MVTKEEVALIVKLQDEATARLHTLQKQLKELERQFAIDAAERRTQLADLETGLGIWKDGEFILSPQAARKHLTLGQDPV